MLKPVSGPRHVAYGVPQGSILGPAQGDTGEGDLNYM